ncbi:hypothetical protein SAMD00019534_118340 [Acytostelium subglobosum LB1]|uniref:hypothetical protein n=1 Tax=Acytostelium subglobosum LB1 TaxID=1410327 RepID=UPI000644F31E|nr:hypothetical protein SAMD00019534_118340 [Acytostelium subglobosum LB1]GAM28658.1 hypothetical protein SAMD00019534_118340 [Acytostelium subglobosum LB1]|eukprot:XP_012748436.1 hypothetical protein SAMD00019534_118340 [Acytostelium subglobosum LB1]
MSKRLRLVQCLLWFPMHMCLIAFLVTLSLKLSGSTMSWYRTMVPLWLMEALLIWFVLVIKSVTYKIWGVLSVLSFALWTALLAVRLEDTGDLSWWGVMTPFWIFLALINVVRREKRKTDYDNYSKGKKVFEVGFSNLVASLAVFSVLQTLVMSGAAQISWTLRFIPLFYYIFVCLFTLFSMWQQENFDYTQSILGLIAAFLILLYFKGNNNMLPYSSVMLIPVYILEIVIFFTIFTKRMTKHF